MRPFVALAAFVAASLACASAPPPADSTGRPAQAPSRALTAGEPAALLVSAQLGAFGSDGPRTEPPDPAQLDRLVLVFAEELDPMTVDGRWFGISRGDGRRVWAREASLAPANEGDENRTLTLLGEFGSPQTPPLAVHVMGNVFTESGVSLRGVDAEIATMEQADRPVVIERLEPAEGRCAEAQAVVRTHWSDLLGDVDERDLDGVELRFANGEVRHPTRFDDHLSVKDDRPRPPEDNVLDLCVDSLQTLVEVRFSAELFTDPAGHRSAAANVQL